MSYRFIALKIRTQRALEQGISARRDAGQGALEYVGMILIAALVIGAVWTVMNGVDVGGAIQGAIDTILGGGD
jgi:hypothetical protein